jgi:hypothetical protein
MIRIVNPGSGLFIPDPDPYFSPIPDPGVKKPPDPGSGSAAMEKTMQRIVGWWVMGLATLTK